MTHAETAARALGALGFWKWPRLRNLQGLWLEMSSVHPSCPSRAPGSRRRCSHGQRRGPEPKEADHQPCSERLRLSILRKAFLNDIWRLLQSAFLQRSSRCFRSARGA